MFQAQGIEKYYGSRALLDGVSLTIGDNERIGLVGRNGCGKSTLLRILAGLQPADRGGLAGVRHGLSIGYLPQQPEFAHGMSVFESAARGLPPGVPLWQVKKALFGLGFRESQLEQAAATLSGGEKTRLMLARLLVGEHDLMLLDEPTAHLDIGMLRWLEDTVNGHRGAILVVSHDRRFLDRTVSRIVELEGGRTVDYAGNYSAYAAAKRQARRRQEADYIVQQREINALREFIARQLGWAEASAAGPKRGRDQRGRISAKVAKRARAAERRIEQMDKIDRPDEAPGLSMLLSPARRSGHVVFEAREAAKSFGPRTLFSGLNAYVTYGERVGIIGSNGAGKTTLVRMLLGEEPPTAGEVRTGASLRPLYVAQEQEELDPGKTVFETLADAGGLTITEARTLLACFLFREDEVFRRVRDLSGGEKSRLAMAGAVVSGANLLVLDEPTNYLDIETRERLEDALSAYTGTLLVVTHDRYLLDRLCHRLLILGDGRIEDYPDTYSRWEERQV